MAIGREDLAALSTLFAPFLPSPLATLCAFATACTCTLLVFRRCRCCQSRRKRPSCDRQPLPWKAKHGLIWRAVLFVIVSFLAWLSLLVGIFLWHSIPASKLIQQPVSGLKATSDVGPCAGRYTEEKDAVCQRSCFPGGGCFRRVPNLCISRRQAVVCRQSFAGHPELVFQGPGGKASAEFVQLPNCTAALLGKEVTWHAGSSVVADSTYLEQGANPWHEAEKLITAALLVQRYVFAQRFHWFTDEHRFTPFTKGIMEALDPNRSWTVFHPYSQQAEQQYECFESAIVVQQSFLMITPGHEDTLWVRDKVDSHCHSASLPTAHNPPETVLLLDRPRRRRFYGLNRLQADIERAVQQMRPSMRADDKRADSRSPAAIVQHRTVGYKQLCQQLEDVRTADVIVTPHGSQHILFLLAAREGALVVEVQPYKYYSSQKHYEPLQFLAAAGMGLRLHQSLALPPPLTAGKYLYHTLSWEECFRQSRLCKNWSRGTRYTNVNITDIVWALEVHASSASSPGSV